MVFIPIQKKWKKKIENIVIKKLKKYMKDVPIYNCKV